MIADFSLILKFFAKKWTKIAFDTTKKILFPIATEQQFKLRQKGFT